MPRRPPYGNLTAALAVVAFLELVFNRLLGHLFTMPACRSTLGCFGLSVGPFLLYLTGTLALVVLAGGIAGHLVRGELFPRGMRFTIAALSMVFVLLLALSLIAGQAPGYYETHLETSFGFVLAMVTSSFLVSATARPRARVALVLLALPSLLHVLAFVAARATWWRDGWMKPEQIMAAGEVLLLLSAGVSPLLLLSQDAGRNRIATGLTVAAGVGTFFFVASLGRPDLIQAIGLFSVHLEIPRATSVLGFGYTAALFGFTVTLVVLLLGPGPARLSGLGLALVGLGGYQSGSPVELSLTLGGVIALATGMSRSASRGRVGPLSTDAWKASLASLADKLAGPSSSEDDRPAVEIVAGERAGTDRAQIRVSRRGRPIEVVVRRDAHAVRELSMTVGVPRDAAPDATLESHETWLARRPEERPMTARIKTGDAAFDRKWGVYGDAPLSDRTLRRRLLVHTDASIQLWAGTAAALLVATQAAPSHDAYATSSARTLRSATELVDILADLIEASAQPASVPAP